ncbi:MAG: hypothetical protein DMG96_11215 [Acidobacteria bacterium]|nr:MAG: hypothetical protein DMG96_11215 [Acidobacteriota bacterium]
MATVSAASTGLAESVKTSPVVSTVTRLASVDILRGLVMIIMALDHTRDFLTNVPFPPELIPNTNAALFFTRFITHFCAPVFAFLAGTGAFLATSRGKSVHQVSRFFFTRGLWLIFLELTIIDFSWTFTPWAAGAVIWILGWSMVCMALIVRLPVRWIAVFGVGMIASHNLLDRVNLASFGKLAWLWTLLHQPGSIQITPHFTFVVLYVLIPWVGVMAAGFAFGAILLRPDRRKWVLTLGFSMTALFLLLRGFNLYGNSTSGVPYSVGPWHVQPTLSLTVISFLNVEKYPPALDYLLMTLGPALILLGLIDGVKAERGVGRILLVYGRVPMLFYVLHLYLIHTLAISAALAFHQPASWLWHGAIFLLPTPAGYGHGLPFIYAMWILAVAILYLPCRWFMQFKARHRDWNWLSYL